MVFTGASWRVVWKLTAISHCPPRLTKTRDTRAALPWNGWCSQRITIASGKSNSSAQSERGGCGIGVSALLLFDYRLAVGLAVAARGPDHHEFVGNVARPFVGFVRHDRDLQRLP